MNESTFTSGPLAEIRARARPGRSPRIVVRRRKSPGSDRYVFILVNIDSPRAGDRILLRPAPGIELAVRGPAVRASGANTDVLYLFAEGTLRIAVAGKPRACIEARVVLPDIPAMKRGARLLGPLFPHQCVPDGRKRHPLDCYFVALDELVVANGLNYMSLCPIAYWHEPDIGSPFPLIGGLSDLSQIDPLFEGAMRCLLWRAAHEGVAVHFYPFEFVSFTHAHQWIRSPLNSANNIHGWIEREAPYAYKGFHAAIKEDDPPGTRDVLLAYFAALARMIDPRQPHAIVPVLEGNSRSVDAALAAGAQGRPLGCNQKSLYRDESWPEMEEHLVNDETWRGLLRSCAFVSCHSCDCEGVTARRLGRLLPSADALDFALLASTDGTGCGQGEASRHRRPDGARPNSSDIAAAWTEGLETAGDRFLGLEIKLLGWEDALTTLPSVARLIQPG